jgi:hypothetical protein
MDNVIPIEYLTNFRNACSSGVVPSWMAMDILLRKASEWSVELVLQHSTPQVCNDLRTLATAILKGQNDDAVTSWRDTEDVELKAGVDSLVQYVSENPDLRVA